MPDMEKVIKGLEHCRLMCDVSINPCQGCLYQGKHDCADTLKTDALAMLKEQDALLREYEKLSQVCFKIEKYLRIADLSILIDRIEEGKVEVLQDDGRLHNSPIMETTIKIRRL